MAVTGAVKPSGSAGMMVSEVDGDFKYSNPLIFCRLYSAGDSPEALFADE